MPLCLWVSSAQRILLPGSRADVLLEPRAAMASLASVLAPLQEADFAVLVAAWLAGDATGAPRRACRLLAARSAGAAEFSEAVLENVYAKLTGADLLRGLTAAPSTVRIPCCTTTCTLCGLDLEIGETRSTYALTWATGMQRVDYERRRCRGCLSHYSSCWVLSAWHDAKFCICSFEQPRHSQEEVRAKFCPAHPPGS